jgi:hypothetical protein
MTVRKYLQLQNAELLAEAERLLDRADASQDESVRRATILQVERILGRMEQIKLTFGILDARSDKSARTAEDHTA